MLVALVLLAGVIGAVSTPFLAAVRATVGFFPAMLGLGALHTQEGLSWVPPLGWWAVWLLIFVVALFLPSQGEVNTD